MCYSGEMSAFFALLGVAMAAYLRYRVGRPVRLSLSILYFAAMELLQAVQYLYIAEPEDGYAMCQNPVNRFLTFLGAVHIAFQPAFINMLFTGMPRQHNIKRRIQGDLINRLCIIGALAFMARYYMAWLDLPWQAPRPSPDCPNYEWVRDGYDGSLGNFTTPNLPGHSCTFRSATSSGHLAWAIPLYQPTYFVPGTFLHFFLMFAPLLAKAESILELLVPLLTGPVLAAFLTPSLNEQASIWCFFSMIQMVVAFVSLLFDETPPVYATLVHEGSLDEKRMEYALVEVDKNNGVSNGHTANGISEKKAQ